MAFLDNSGDIILDAVLTDTGRFRLAKGEFKIKSFALGDDEIDYALYNNTHASGSSYYDLEILQTPVLEAFTNNASSLKSKLMTVSRNDLLYLPIIKLNESLGNQRSTQGNFLVAVNGDTETSMTTAATGEVTKGVMYGETTSTPITVIKLDQGIDSNEAGGPAATLSAELTETAYIIEIDNRLGSITAPKSSTSKGAAVSTGGRSVGDKLATSYIDDDNIASYYVDTTNDPDLVSFINNTTSQGSVIAGQRGTRLEFAIAASLDLNSSTFLFSKLGGGTTTSITGGAGSVTCLRIDTTVRVIGVTTGYQVDIPVRFIRKQ
mgnify:FL=1